VYWQVVLLGIAVAVAAAILGIAVFMPPAPLPPPQLYVKVVPSGGSYLLYVGDSGKALKEVWYSKNGGPLLMANGPISAKCGDRVEVVAVYADGSRQTAATVVKCTKPLKVGLSSTQSIIVSWSASLKLLDVVEETDPDAVGIRAYLSYCNPPDAYVTLIAETRYGSQQLPYKAYLRLDGPYSTSGPQWTTTFGTFPITVDVKQQPLYGITLNGIYSPRDYFDLVIFHLPSFATVSDYIAGSPITIGFLFDTSGNVYVNIGGVWTYVGYCASYTETREKTVQELAQLNATLTARYYYYDNETKKVYEATLVAYKKPDGSYVFNAYHTPSPLKPNDIKGIWIVHTRYGEIVTTLPEVMGAVVDPQNSLLGTFGIALEMFGIGTNSTAAKELARFSKWLSSLPDPQRGVAVKALFAGVATNVTGLVKENYGGAPITLINRNVEYTVRVVEAFSRSATVTVGSISVPGVFLGLVQGSTPFIVPDYVAILLANYTSIPAVASYR